MFSVLHIINGSKIPEFGDLTDSKADSLFAYINQRSTYHEIHGI